MNALPETDDYQSPDLVPPDEDDEPSGWCSRCGNDYCGHDTTVTRGPEPDYDSDRNIDMEES